MKLKYFRIDPGGNVTAILKGNFSKQEKIEISKTILSLDAKIEQVGFWREPKNPQALARLEMMGGEFCGNAIRCLAYLIWQQKGENNFFIESSAIIDPIKVKTLSHYAKITLPLKNFELREVKVGSLVVVPGISHLIVNQSVSKEDVRKILIDNGLLENKAVGVISVKKEGNRINIKPTIWVRDTKTLYEETACASGSLAVAYFFSRLEYSHNFIIQQPSGKDFMVTIVNKRFISLGGPILGIREKSISL